MRRPALTAFLLLAACAHAPTGGNPAARAASRLAALEEAFGVRLGVCAIDTADGAILGLHENERFAMCSTFKAVLAGAVLAREERSPGTLAQTLRIAPGDVLSYAPVTSKHVGEEMSVADLCAAAVVWSDNTAANRLLDLLGGPAQVTAFARTQGDADFRLDRREPELNGAVPGDPRDTTTPRAMAATLRRLALGDALAPAGRARLLAWMRACATGARKIRAGVPAGWEVADKTGGGDHGVANDVAVLFPPGRAPVVLVVFTCGKEKTAAPREEAVAQAARIVSEWARAR